MDKNTFKVGDFKLRESEILNELKKFIQLYERRPIKNNKGGMGFNNMFYFYLVLKNKEPSLVIESGVFKGQSTWLIENTLPKSQIVSIDIDLSQREFISSKSNYSNVDFKFHDFSKIPDDTLVFFDDHVNHLDRLIESKFFNIKNIVLEDNYSNNSGDFQTLKQIYNNNIFNHNPGILSLIKTSLIFNKVIINKIFKKNYFARKEIDKISKRIRDGYDLKNFDIIKKNISLYYEFPLSIYKMFNNSEEQIKSIFPENIIKNINKDKSPFTYLELV